jgi:hypothetical protein
VYHCLTLTIAIRGSRIVPAGAAPREILITVTVTPDTPPRTARRPRLHRTGPAGTVAHNDGVSEQTTLLPAMVIPDGPVNLWIAVTSTTGEIMGAAPAKTAATWLWRDGRLCLGYGPVSVVVTRAGRYASGLICAVSPDTRTFRPMWRITLGRSRYLDAGQVIHILDGVVALTPEH